MFDYRIKHPPTACAWAGPSSVLDFFSVICPRTGALPQALRTEIGSFRGFLKLYIEPKREQLCPYILKYLLVYVWYVSLG